MFDLEDEFIIESYRVPWLIWVQLLVTILLVIVLVFGFGIFALDVSDNSNCSSASSSSLSRSRSHGKKSSLNATSCSASSKVQQNESIHRERDPGTSKDIVQEDSIEIEESSAKDIALFRLFGRQDHPCNYLGLAKEAFLKCLGLGCSSESPRNKRHCKRE